MDQCPGSSQDADAASAGEGMITICENCLTDAATIVKEDAALCDSCYDNSFDED